MNHASATPPPPHTRFKLVTGAPQHFGDRPVIILRDYETRIEYPFITRASALKARVLILDGATNGLVGKPFDLDAFDRILTTLETI